MVGVWKKILAHLKRFDSHPTWITFVAEYEDGTIEALQIDPYTLARGDHVARIIARERQEAGELKPGKIVLVYREKPLGWIRTSLGWLNLRAAPRGFNFSAAQRDEDGPAN